MKKLNTIAFALCTILALSASTETKTLNNNQWSLLTATDIVKKLDDLQTKIKKTENNLERFTKALNAYLTNQSDEYASEMLEAVKTLSGGQIYGQCIPSNHGVLSECYTYLTTTILGLSMNQEPLAKHTNASECFPEKAAELNQKITTLKQKIYDDREHMASHPVCKKEINFYTSIFSPNYSKFELRMNNIGKLHKEISQINNRWHEAIETLKNNKINDVQREKEMEKIIGKLGYKRNCWDPRTWLYQPVFTQCANYAKHDIIRLEKIKNDTYKYIKPLIENISKIEKYIVSHPRYQDEQNKTEDNS